MSKNNEEKRALQFNAALNGKSDDTTPEDLPYVRMAKALQEDAAEEITMDKATQNQQRAHLLQMAKNLKEAPAPSKASTKKATVPAKRPWYLWAGAFATVAAVLVIVFINQTTKGPWQQAADESAGMLGKATLSLIIPEAHAGDAFSILVEKGDEDNAAIDTTFKVTSKVDVSEEDLKQSLRIVPASGDELDGVDFDIKRQGGGEYLVTPKKELDPGSVYQVTIATAIAEDSGETRPREFSWAIQTQNVFRILQFVPGNQNTYVPLNTGIEVTLSQTGWSDPENFVDIQPPTDGRFETHGRTLVFVPSNPLKPNTIYTVTYKKGWGIPNGQTLREDAVMRFETEGKSAEEKQVSIDPYQPFIEASTQGEALVYVSITSEAQNQQINVTGYTISQEQVREAMQEYEEVPIWAYRSRKQSDALSSRATNEAFNLTSSIESIEYQYAIRLPNTIAPGNYVIKLETENADPAWVLLQKTNVAAYTMVDRNQMLVWVLNKETAQPMSNTLVTLDEQQYHTDAQGIATIATPSAWNEYQNEKQGDWYADRPVELLTIGETVGGLVLMVTPEYRWMFGRFDTETTQEQMDHWSYLFPDRPLYRVRDQVEFFGLMQNRNTKQGAGEIRVELRSNMLDYATYKAKVIAQSELETDARGFFKGRLVWTGAAKPGYYQLVLVKNGQDVYKRSIEIRDLIKPAYEISILPEQIAVHAGQTVRGTIKASFFDGTPYANARIQLRTYGGFTNQQNIEVQTDDGGFASFEFTTEKPSCDRTSKYPYCANVDYMQIEARPTTGEEGEIVAQTNIAVWRGYQHLEAMAKPAEADQGVIDVRVRNVDLSKNEAYESESVLGDGVPGTKVTSEVYEEHWDQIQTGTRYDPIEKTTYPTYRYEQRRVNVGSYTAVTDASGKATIRFPMHDEITYRVLTWIQEPNGVEHLMANYVSKYNGYFGTGPGNEQITLEPMGDKDKTSYAMGETVGVQFVQNNQPFSTEGAAFLYVQASRGIQAKTVSREANYQFNLSEKHIPNVSVYGIVFTKNGFTQGQYVASYDTKEQELEVVIETDQEQYAPGNQVGIRAIVKTKDGKPVSGAQVAIAVVDEALLSMSQLQTEEDPIPTLYRWVSDGIYSTTWSHQADRMMAGGGAEMGGFEMSKAIRSNFKDQAGFLELTTDQSGIASGSFIAPDNITSWRLTASVVTASIQAGHTMARVPVTKPVFVEAVIPPYLLTTDQPVLKMRAHGTELPTTGDISYSVDIPSLGIENQTITGQVNAPVYVAIDKLTPGTHQAVIRVSASGKTDAFLKQINVRDSYTSHEERVITELGPGTALPDPGTSEMVDVVFETKTRAAMRQHVEALAHPWSARVESVLAGYLMRNLLTDYYLEESDDAQAEPDYLQYQLPEGGIAILPYASQSAEVSAKAAMATPEVFDRTSLANYFWEITDNPKVSREESINALAGLAALGQPVLERLRVASQQDDLSWRERIALLRGLEAAGDREAARSILQQFIDQAETIDDQMRLKVSDDVGEEVQATVQVAAMAAIMAHPDAEKLMNYVQNVWQHEVLTDLDRAIYLAKMVPTLSTVPVQIKYAIGSNEQSLDLSEWPSQTVTFTADEVQNLRITSVNGPAVASFIRRVEGDVQESNPLLSISRSYQTNDKAVTELNEGDQLTVQLVASWDPKAQDGCYVVRDRLPGTLMPLVSISFDEWRQNDLNYPYEMSNGEVGFITCKSDIDQVIRYQARVISLGTYTADRPLIQSMQVPGLATVGAKETLIVK